MVASSAATTSLSSQKQRVCQTPDLLRLASLAQVFLALAFWASTLLMFCQSSISRWLPRSTFLKLLLSLQLHIASGLVCLRHFHRNIRLHSTLGLLAVAFQNLLRTNRPVLRHPILFGYSWVFYQVTPRSKACQQLNPLQPRWKYWLLWVPSVQKIYFFLLYVVESQHQNAAILASCTWITHCNTEIFFIFESDLGLL